MIVNGKQYAVVIFKNGAFASCKTCPFNTEFKCVAEASRDEGCMVEGQKRGIHGNHVTFVEVNHE